MGVYRLLLEIVLDNIHEISKCLMECKDFYPRPHIVVLTCKTLVNDAYILEEVSEGLGNVPPVFSNPPKKFSKTMVSI